VSDAPRTCIVVPCYNEAARLDRQAFVAAVQRDPGLCFVFVNDGSRDATLQVLHELAASDPTRLRVVDQQPNQGKAAAVRAGMLHALTLGPEHAGYWDADLATPLEEVPRFVAVLDAHPELQVVFGSRVQLLGRTIERSSARHYLGRIFATVASTLLALPVYDTQCGAKLFRADPDTAALFGTPFEVNWTFDVELIARLIRLRADSGRTPAARAIYELPLDRWHDVAGSKVRPHDFVVALFEVLRIWRSYLSRGARSRTLALARSANESEPAALLKSATRADTGSTPANREEPR
jgi:dolichyl-phosphate beta-glucosyltransferase